MPGRRSVDFTAKLLRAAASWLPATAGKRGPIIAAEPALANLAVFGAASGSHRGTEPDLAAEAGISPGGAQVTVTIKTVIVRCGPVLDRPTGGRHVWTKIQSLSPGWLRCPHRCELVRHRAVVHLGAVQPVLQADSRASGSSRRALGHVLGGHASVLPVDRASRTGTRGDSPPLRHPHERHHAVHFRRRGGDGR